MYAGVINDKHYGGVFVSTDFGQTWKQQSEGLNGRDVFLLGQSRDGMLVAGTSDGLFRWDGSSWVPCDRLESHTAAPVKWRAAGHSRNRERRTARTRRVTPRQAKPEVSDGIRGRITALDVSGDVWYAATSEGVFRSGDRGAAWEGPVLRTETPGSFNGAGDYRTFAEAGAMVYAGRRQGIMVSSNRGATWQAASLPAGLSVLQSLTVAGDGSLWAGGVGGVFYSPDHGKSWTHLSRLPVSDVNSLTWLPALRRVVLTSAQSTVIFAIDPRDKNWKWWNPGWTVRSAASVGGRLVAASLYNGVVTQPEPETASAGGGGVQAAQR